LSRFSQFVSALSQTLPTLSRRGTTVRRRKTILEFVAAVTEKGGKDYVEPAQRIAVFDNDGTLWVEYPMYTQVLFAFDRVKKLAPQHPEWKTKQPFKALLEGDMKTVGASGMKGLMEIIMATTSGMTAKEFEKTVTDWLATHKQPKFKRLYTESVYQHIGRRPILAFGNSDSDIQMIEYTMAGEGRRLGLFVHHTDAEREYAYDRKSHVGTLDKALDQADAKGWIIVDMKKDWNKVFPGK